MNTTHFNDEGLILLQAAILEQAIQDYKIELKCGGGHRLEKWFLSGWGQMLSRGHGDEIIERIRREVNNDVRDELKVAYYENGYPNTHEEHLE
jgi:hypothetical protein